MTRRMYWGIATLIILLIGFSVFLLTRTPETEPDIIYRAPTPSEKAEVDRNIQDAIDNKAQKNSSILEVDGPQVKQTETKLQNDPQSDLKDLSREQLQEIYDSFYTRFGLKPPPPGYEYRWADINVPLLDENGQPVLHKIGDPIIDIAIEVGFAPTKEEYDQLNQLKRDKKTAKFKGLVEQAASITQKIEELEALVQRERPVLKGTMWMGKPGEAYNRERVRRMSREKLNEALRSYGLEHLIEESKPRFR
ncbi:MAG: hypothetical protein F4118_07720 [Acidimicrobiaceae bacterium]|nr:hypothetical protein [Candidatus Poribacteria bacterium]MYI36305.1 hypothetical protein [Acidimicrobiaceae bacterium]